MGARADVLATDQQVLTALIQIAGGSSVVTASARQIAKRTGIARATVARAIRRLVKAGRLTPAKTASHFNAARRYVITDPHVDVVQGSPLWSRLGLGATAGVVYAALRPEAWTTTTEVQARTGMSRSCILENLKRLHSSGLINGCNPKDDQSPLKRIWLRYDDPDYFDNYEQILTAGRLKIMTRRLSEEQADWRSMNRAHQNTGNETYSAVAV